MSFSKIEALLTSSVTTPSAFVALVIISVWAARIGEVAGNDGGPAAAGNDRVGNGLRFIRRAVVMDRHGPSVGGEILDDGASDAARAAGDQGRQGRN